MINVELIESFWERVSIAEGEDKFIITLLEAKQLIEITKNDIYNNVNTKFEPIKNKAENLYNEFASLINDAWIKSRSKTPYTYKSFFDKYIKLKSSTMCLYVESNSSDDRIGEVSDHINIITESFLK